jgi:hypothetical protein
MTRRLPRLLVRLRRLCRSAACGAYYAASVSLLTAYGLLSATFAAVLTTAVAAVVWLFAREG